MFKIAKKTSRPVEPIKFQQATLTQPAFFTNIRAFILPTGIGKVRSEIFRNGLLKNGAFLIDETKTLEIQRQKQDTHFLVIYDETIITSWDTLAKTLANKTFFTNSNDLKYVNTRWLSECLRTKSLIEINDYEIKPLIIESNENPVNSAKRSTSTKPNNDNIKKRKIVEHDSSNSNQSDDNEEYEFKKVNTNTWTCAHSSKDQSVNLNKHITDKLEQLSQIYENTNEKYKVIAYQKAIITLKRHSQTITSYQVSALSH